MKPAISSLLEDIIAAFLASVTLGGFVSVLFWLITGLSPWPMVVLGLVAGFGFGLSLLSVATPRRGR